MARRVSKTIVVAYLPKKGGGEERYVIRRDERGWQWEPNAWSSHLDNAIWQVEQKGGRVVREPNPAYRSTYVSDMMKLLGFVPTERKQTR